MLVDFYQLGSKPLERVIGVLAGKLLAEGERLLVIAEDERFLARLDRQLWDQGPTAFLPHGMGGGPDDARQPILLSTTPDAPNLARNLLIADGVWRDAALAYDRTFYLFGPTLENEARQAWRSIRSREDVQLRHWIAAEGGWTLNSQVLR